MANVENEIADKILTSSRLSASKLGLRFDKVAVRVVGRLRDFAEAEIRADATIIVTISAPIRLPAKTANDLAGQISAFLLAGKPHGDHCATSNGNSVQMRLVARSSKHVPKLIGFVHSPGSTPKRLLDLAEHWLRSQA